MKKVLLVLLMVTIAATVFAVDFSLSAHLSSGYLPYFQQLSGTPFIAFPSIGIAVGLDKVDILAEIDFGLYRQTENKGATDEYKDRSWALGFNIGVAPKVKASDRFSFSFPILFKFTHLGFNTKYKNTSAWLQTSVEKQGLNAIGIDFGARATFAISRQWGAFIGFQAPLFTVITQGKQKLLNGTTNEGKDPGFYFLSYGTVDLGVRFTF